MHNTPETKLTALSPELLRSDNAAPSKSKTPRKIPPAFSLLGPHPQALPTRFAGLGSSVQAPDPFTMTTMTDEIHKCVEPPKLSPAAQTFTPRFVPAMLPSNLGPIKTTEFPSNPAEAYRRYLAPVNEDHQLTADLNAKRAPELSVLGTPGRRMSFSKIGQFSAESVATRYIALTQVSINMAAHQVHGLFNVSNTQIRIRHELI